MTTPTTTHKAATATPGGIDPLPGLLERERGGEASVALLTDIARLYLQRREPAQAAPWYERALAAGPMTTINFVDYVMALMDSGQLDRAAEVTAARLETSRKEYALVNLMGVIFKRQRRFEDALAQYRLAGKLDPKALGPWINAGNVYMDMLDGVRAEEMYQKTCRMDPKNAEYVRLLGRSQQVQGQNLKAVATLRRCLMMNPKLFNAMADLTLALFRADRPGEALDFISKKMEAFPQNPKLMRAAADLLSKMGRPAESMRFFEASLMLEPNDIDGWIQFGRSVSRTDREKANACFRRALQIDRKSMRALNAFCGNLVRSRYGDEAEHIAEAYSVACELAESYKVTNVTPSDDVKATLIRCLDFERVDELGDKHVMWDAWLREGNAGAFHQELARVLTLDDRIDLLNYHRKWGEKVAAARLPDAITRAPRGPREKIRIGFFSSDLRNHPVGYFALPLLQNYDKSRFEVFGYSCFSREADDVQKHMATLVDGFRVWPGASELAVAQGMADDRLDILIEMGATTMERFEAMAYRPAPVQVSWLGYPHSSGLLSIDYILVDPFLKPSDPRLLIEKPLEVPETWVTVSKGGFVEMPINPEIPETRRGFITFGTMNNPYKYTREGIAAWAAIMNRVPNSRFLFVRPEGKVDAFRANAEGAFAVHGISPDRLMFTAVRGAHLTHYNDIDIALDTLPHVGGTTTCETIWMGVPVVTLVGPAFFERLSYSNLSNAGLGDLCTFTVADYIDKAVALAGDRPLRQHMRTNLRQQVKDSPLGQAERFAETFYQTITDVLS